MKNFLKLLLIKAKLKKINTLCFSPFVSRKAKIGSHSIINEGSLVDSNCEIGNYVCIGKYNNITKAKIGNYCSLANNISIGQGEHDKSRVSTSSLFYSAPYDELTQNSCIIGNDVWIGVDSIILRGVTIGDGAIIGANSVVTKDIPPFAVAVGSPAKVIHYRFDEEKQKKISQSQWWNKSLEDAKKFVHEIDQNR